jgi:hypothetical protein
MDIPMLLLVLALQTAASPTEAQGFRLVPEEEADVAHAPKTRYRLTSMRTEHAQRAIWTPCEQPAP